MVSWSGKSATLQKRDRTQKMEFNLACTLLVSSLPDMDTKCVRGLFFFLEKWLWVPWNLSLTSSQFVKKGCFIFQNLLKWWWTGKRKIHLFILGDYAWPIWCIVDLALQTKGHIYVIKSRPCWRTRGWRLQTGSQLILIQATCYGDEYSIWMSSFCPYRSFAVNLPKRWHFIFEDLGRIFGVAMTTFKYMYDSQEPMLRKWTKLCLKVKLSYCGYRINYIIM